MGEFIENVFVHVFKENKAAGDMAALFLTLQMQSRIVPTISIFRYKQSLDDPAILFWRPFNVRGELMFMYFLKLDQGKVVANPELTDLLTLPLQVTINAGHEINVLELVNKSFLYGSVY